MDGDNENSNDGISEILRFKMKRNQGKPLKAQNPIEESLSFEGLKYSVPEEKIPAIKEEANKTQKPTAQSSNSQKEEIKENRIQQASTEGKRKTDELDSFFSDKREDNKKVKKEKALASPEVTVPKDIVKKYDTVSGCKFCNIIHISKQKLIYEDDECAAFNDKRKCSAQEHILICPKKHILNTSTLTKSDIPLLKHLEEVGTKILKQKKNSGSFRFGYHQPPMNSVNHLHLHAFLLPLTNDYLNKVIYGFKLASTEKIIQNLNLGIPSIMNDKDVNPNLIDLEEPQNAPNKKEENIIDLTDD